MATDNVDIFKKVIFSIPPVKTLLALITGTGIIYGVFTFLAFAAFAGNLFEGISIWMAPVSAVFLYIIPTLASGELLKQFLPDYPRKWGYFLAFCNQLILFIYVLILSGAESFTSAWNIVWIASITVYLSNLVVLLLTMGYDYLNRLSILSALHPVLVLGFFHFSMGRLLEIPLEAYLWNLLLLPAAFIVLMFALALNEYLLKTNVSGISAMWLTSALFQKKQEELDLGYPSRPDVHNWEIENHSGSFSFSVPWIHPGPLEGFGGGRITSDIIEELNEDGEGFFLHVPSTHKSDPSCPEDYTKILDAMEEPEKIGKASKLLEKDYGGLKLYGRRFGDQKIVFIEHESFDDYEIPIFEDFVDKKDVMLVDLHNHERNSGERKEMWYNTVEADQLRDNLSDFIEELEEQELFDYAAGSSVDLERTPVSALVEEIDGEKTLLFGIEGNEAGRELKELEKEFKDRFDKVMVFSTDTHQSIHQLSSKKQVEKKRVSNTVEEAVENVSDALTGFSVSQADEMRLLQEDYSGLIFSINILVRSLALTLVLVYLGLIIWVL